MLPIIPSPRLFFIFIFAASLQVCALSQAADFELKPRVSGSTEYNDNVQETRDGKGDFIGIVKPGLSATYDHSRVYFDLSYDFELKKYMDQVLEDERNHYLTSDLNVEAIKDIFYVDISEDYSKVYTDTAKGDLPSGDTSIGTTNKNQFRVRPHFELPLQERTSLSTGGEFSDIWYSDNESIDKRIYSLFGNIEHGLSDRWIVISGLEYAKQDPRWVDGGFNRYGVTLGTSYAYAEGSLIELSVTPTYTDYIKSDAHSKKSTPYTAAITHAISSSLTAKASSSMDFSENPLSADTDTRFVHLVGLEGEYERGKLNASLSYNDYGQSGATTRVTYWRPSVGGTHSLAKRLDLVYNVYMDYHTNPNPYKYIFSLLSLRYSLSETTNAELSYRYKMNDQKNVNSDYSSNTIGLSLSWNY